MYLVPQALKKLLKAAAAETQQRGGADAAIQSGGQEQVQCLPMQTK